MPKDDEILIRVHAATVTAADWRILSRTVPTGFGLILRLLFGWSKPKQPILGTAAAGVIVEVGKAAALCFGGTTALHFFRGARLKVGERVLINGAAGAVGGAAVQLDRHAGAHVTGVCSSANVELVRSLGADEVIDYTQEDFTRSGRRYGIIMDNAGTAPFSRRGGALNAGGRLLSVVAGLPATTPVDRTLGVGDDRPRVAVSGQLEAVEVCLHVPACGLWQSPAPAP